MQKIIVFIILLSVFKVEGQQIFQREKRDFQWITGSGSIEGYPNFGATMFDFSSKPTLLYQQYNPIQFDVVNAGICDTSGQYLFHTNGISIVNRDGEIIEGGERINPGNYTDSWVDVGVPVIQGGLILPLPENDSIYYLFHETRDWSFNHPGGYSSVINFFYYSIINMKANEGKGEVLEKNILFIDGTNNGKEFSNLGFGEITAVRHSDGRDWWLTIPRYYGNEYYTMLFDTEGIHSPELQIIGDTMPEGTGQCFFSPNGLKYVQVNLHKFEENYIEIYDFDRSIGQFILSDIILDTHPTYAGGGAISENSRFLYFSSYSQVFQYDLEAENIEESRVVVAEYDPDFTSPPLDAPTKFFMAQLAPDGKIYICSNTQVKYYSVIHEPNKKGLACRAEPHGVELLTYNAFSIPNFPYYGLGPLDGSPADTLGIDNPPPTARFEYVQDSTDVHDIAFYNATLFSPEATMYIVPDDAYHWTFGDGEESNEKHPVHTYFEDGAYEVCLTATNYSGSDTWCDTVYVNVVGTQEPVSLLQQARLFPNPVSDYFFFDYILPVGIHATARLYDVRGRLVKERSLKSGNVSQGWDVRDLVSGVYFFVVESERGVLFREKVIRNP